MLYSRPANPLQQPWQSVHDKPADDDSDMSESEDELLTVKDAVEHLVRSNRHSRANSSDKLDQLEPASMSSRGKSEPQPAAEVQPPPARVTFGDAGHIALPATSSLPNLATRRSQGGSRETNDMSGSATERSESSEAWSEERIRQLEEDKAAIERLWGEHAQENDIGVLKFKLVGLAGLPSYYSSSSHYRLLEHTMVVRSALRTHVKWPSARPQDTM